MGYGLLNGKPMKLRFSRHQIQAWTLIDLLVVIAVLAILAAMIDWGPTPNMRRKAERVCCLSNLKQIGLADQLWANNNQGKFPMAISSNAVLCFQLISNELFSPRILFCPADKNSTAATNFSTAFSAKNVSYFAGLGAKTSNSPAWLAGDSGFAIGRDQVRSGLIEISSTAPIAWTSARHHFAGNIIFADGHVEMLNNSNLVQSLGRTGLATNRLAIP